MEHIIIGAEFVIGIILGIILGVIAIAAVGFIIVTLFIALEALYESITNFLEKRKKANKKNKLNMAKEKEIATDVHELVVTNEIKEAFKKVLEFEYYACWNELQDILSDIKKAFFHDDVYRLIKMMNRFQVAYLEIINTGSIDYAYGELHRYFRNEREEDLMEKYGELQIDEATLRMLVEKITTL